MTKRAHPQMADVQICKELSNTAYSRSSTLKQPGDTGSSATGRVPHSITAPTATQPAGDIKGPALLIKAQVLPSSKVSDTKETVCKQC